MLLLLIKTKKLLFVCLFLFTFTRGVMKPWGQIREARPYHERDSSSKSDFNTQANQRKRKTIYCELNTHWTLRRTRKVIPPTVVQGVGWGGGVDGTPLLHCYIKWQILDKYDEEKRTQNRSLWYAMVYTRQRRFLAINADQLTSTREIRMTPIICYVGNAVSQDSSKDSS